MPPGPKIASFLEMPRNGTQLSPKTLPFKAERGYIVLEDTGAIFIVVFHVNYLYVYKNI